MEQTNRDALTRCRGAFAESILGVCFAVCLVVGLSLPLVACGSSDDDSVADARGGWPRDTSGTPGDAAGNGQGDSQDDATAPEGPCQTELGDLPIGAGCTSNCDCASGLCYNEVYLRPFRFCTKPCGGPSEGCGQDGACLNFSGTLATQYGLRLANFCMPRCNNLDECQAIDPAYNRCTHPSFAEFDGRTVGAPSCQVVVEE